MQATGGGRGALPRARLLCSFPWGLWEGLGKGPLICWWLRGESSVHSSSDSVRISYTNRTVTSVKERATSGWRTGSKVSPRGSKEPEGLATHGAVACGLEAMFLELGLGVIFSGETEKTARGLV